QPHLARQGKDLSFFKRRLMQDRSVDVWNVFRRSIETVYDVAARNTGGHSASQCSMEHLLRSSFRREQKIDLIYADPPYTAQQYSRFYHIPETLVSYEVPHLQIKAGRNTRGLYPIGRFKSRFCSKRQA